MPHEASRKMRIAYLTHTSCSDWNNGNAHFLWGLMRAMITLGHDVMMLERETEWSLKNLLLEKKSEESLAAFRQVISDLGINTYAVSETREQWLER